MNVKNSLQFAQPEITSNQMSEHDFPTANEKPARAIFTTNQKLAHLTTNRVRTRLPDSQ